MFGSFFPVERKASSNLQKSESLSTPNDKLKTQNERMKKQIDMLYHVLVDKETCIVKLKKFIFEELKKPEYENNYESLEDQLNCILREEDYDPRHADAEVQHDLRLLERNITTLSSESEDTTINKQFADKSLRINTEVKENGKAEGIEKEELDNSPTYSTDVNENLDRLSLSDKEKSDRSEESTTVSVLSNSIDYKRRPRLSLMTQKVKDLKRIPVSTVEQHTVTRRLFNFELELKEYSPATFDAIKLIISRKNVTAEEVHEEIEELAENAAKSKYFNKVFPTDTSEKIADELENYVFELLYPKLFVVCDDVRGRSQQFLDRLTVLKSYVTFEMLEIPVEMRKESLYVQPIREMRKMTEFKAPVWKIQCFQNAVNHILNAFSENVHRIPSSDELFPVLVYTVLQANIDLLSFNVDYIYTYIRKCHLMGQMGFLIINLKAVIQFLQGVNGNSLSKGKLEMRKV